MRYVAAYLLSGLSGKDQPTEADIISILESVGVDVNKVKLQRVLEELHGKNIDEIIATGQEKLAAFNSGPIGCVGEIDDTLPAGSPKREDSTKEEKREETEESDDDLGFGLFD